jgi:hypothetical protein
VVDSTGPLIQPASPSLFGSSFPKTEAASNLSDDDITASGNAPVPPDHLVSRDQQPTLDRPRTTSFSASQELGIEVNRVAIYCNYTSSQAFTPSP